MMNKKLSDKPSRQDIFDRVSYVDVIFDSLTKSEDNFNLAISAQWGEGKSTILELLEPKLIEKDYIVLKFNPWKYTQDPLSIKRKFLIDIYRQLKLDLNETTLYVEEEKQSDRTFKEDLKSVWKNFRSYLLYFLITAIVIFILLYLIKYFTKSDINLVKVFSEFLIIPAISGFFPFLQKISEIKVKQISPKVESAEQFESLFNKAIGTATKNKKESKVIIFIDDLDRCDEKEVEQVLTALFTFFNNELCSYVITADHTIIKKYVGNLLSSEKDSEEIKDKLAADYLKKIFQINFILPKIPSNILKKWIEELLEDLNLNFKDSKLGLSNLIDLIYFNLDGNPRKIKYLIRTLSFHLSVIKAKMKNSEDLQVILDYPELLAKILVIQDLAPKQFEQISKKSKMLKDFEVVAGNGDKIDRIFKQEPKFYNSKTRNTGDVDPAAFIYQSGTTGFEEIDLPNVDTYIQYAKNLEFKNVEQMLGNNTEKLNLMLIREMIQILTESKTNETNLAKTIIHSISLIENEGYTDELIEEFIISLIGRYDFSSSEIPALTKDDFNKIISKFKKRHLEKMFDFSGFNSNRIQIYQSFSEGSEQIKSIDSFNFILEKIAKESFSTPSAFPSYFQYINKVDPRCLDNKVLFDEINSKIDLLTEDSQRQLILFMVKNQNSLNTEAKNFLKKIILNLIKDPNVDKNIFGINLVLEDALNIVSSKEFSDAVVLRISSVDTGNIHRFIDNAINKQVLEKLDLNDELKIRSTLIDQTLPANPNRAYMVAKLPEIMSLPEKLIPNSKELFFKLLDSLSDRADSTEEIISKELSKHKEVWVSKKDKKRIEKKIDEVLSLNVNPTVQSSLGEVKTYLISL